MKPVQFSRHNQTLEAYDPSLVAVPVLTSRYGDGTPEIITCWQLSFWERLIVLFRGRVLVQLLSNKPVPVKASVDFGHVQQVEQWYEENS